jgi:hypothetical protein
MEVGAELGFFEPQAKLAGVDCKEKVLSFYQNTLTSSWQLLEEVNSQYPSGKQMRPSEVCARMDMDTVYGQLLNCNGRCFNSMIIFSMFLLTIKVVSRDIDTFISLF